MHARVAVIALAALPVLTAASAAPSPSSAPTAGSSVVRCPTGALPVPDGGPPDPPSRSSTVVGPARIAPAPSGGPVGAWTGTWAPMPEAPITPRTGAATDLAVWSDRIYVWGGRDADGRLLADGAWFDVAAARWEVLPDSGLVPRERFGFDADGLGITIWGGIDAAGEPLADGARFGAPMGPSAPGWVSLPPAPLTPGPASMSGDINITLVVTPGAATGDPPRWAVLDSDSVDEEGDDVLGWDDPSDPDVRVHGHMPAPSLPAGIAYEFASARDEALLLSYQPDGTAVATWFTDMWPGTWSEPVAVPLPATGSCPAVGLPSFGWLRTAADGAAVGLMVEASGHHRWHALPEPPAEAMGGMLVAAPGYLIAADGLVAWDVAGEVWRTLPPLPDGPRSGVSAAWSHGRLYVWGGEAVDGSLPASGWVFTPDVPAGAHRLPGGYAKGYSDCGGVGTSGVWRLHGDPDDPMLVWFQQRGRRVPTTWPDGYLVRFGDGGFVVLDPEGRVVAREGQTYRERRRPDDLDPCWTGEVAAF